MIDYQALKNELLNDPASLGYGSAVAIGDDCTPAGLLNSLSGPGAATVQDAVISRDAFLLAISPCLLTIPTLSSELKDKWDRVLATVRATDSVHVMDPRVSLLLDSSISDGVLTSDQRAAVGKRTGSRAEALFGAGTVISADDVGRALRGS